MDFLVVRLRHSPHYRGSKTSSSTASAMMNRKTKSDRYDDRSFKYMNDNLMFNGDSHEKKMSETDRKPGNTAKYGTKNFTYQDVSAENYRNFYSVPASLRTDDMKQSIRASLNMLANPTDKVNGANAWWGNGRTHFFRQEKKL